MGKEILETVSSFDLLESDMTIVRRVISGVMSDPLRANESELWECIDIITKAFQENQCQNIRVILQVLCLACDAYYYVCTMDLACWSGKSLSDILFQPYEDINSEDITDCVLDSATEGNLKLLKLLLSFGAIIEPPRDNALYDCLFFLRSFIRRHYGYSIPETWLEDFKDSTHLKPEEKNRIHLFSIALCILESIFDVPENGENVVKAVRLLFKALPFTPFSSREMRMFLERFLRAIPEKQCIEGIIRAYEHHFPESIDPGRIRSLRDLCRCRVRESLRRSRKIWYGVPMLPLPSFLKKFILLETEDWHPVNLAPNK